MGLERPSPARIPPEFTPTRSPPLAASTSAPNTPQRTASDSAPETARSTHTPACYHSTACTSASLGHTADTSDTGTPGATTPHAQYPQRPTHPSASTTLLRNTQRSSPPPSPPPATHRSSSVSCPSLCSTWNTSQQLSPPFPSPTLRNPASRESDHIGERGAIPSNPEMPLPLFHKRVTERDLCNFLSVNPPLCSLKVCNETSRWRWQRAAGGSQRFSVENEPHHQGRSYAPRCLRSGSTG